MCRDAVCRSGDGALPEEASECRRIFSPRKKYFSPRKKYFSPRKNFFSPRKNNFSPRKTALPPPQMVSPWGRGGSGARRACASWGVLSGACGAPTGESSAKVRLFSDPCKPLCDFLASPCLSGLSAKWSKNDKTKMHSTHKIFQKTFGQSKTSPYLCTRQPTLPAGSTCRETGQAQ